MGLIDKIKGIFGNNKAPVFRINWDPKSAEKELKKASSKLFDPVAGFSKNFDHFINSANGAVFLEWLEKKDFAFYKFFIDLADKKLDNLSHQHKKKMFKYLTQYKDEIRASFKGKDPWQDPQISPRDIALRKRDIEDSKKLKPAPGELPAFALESRPIIRLFSHFSETENIEQKQELIAELRQKPESAQRLRQYLATQSSVEENIKTDMEKTEEVAESLYLFGPDEPLLIDPVKEREWLARTLEESLVDDRARRTLLRMSLAEQNIQQDYENRPLAKFFQYLGEGWETAKENIAYNVDMATGISLTRKDISTFASSLPGSSDPSVRTFAGVEKGALVNFPIACLDFPAWAPSIPDQALQYTFDPVGFKKGLKSQIHHLVSHAAIIQDPWEFSQQAGEATMMGLVVPASIGQGAVTKIHGLVKFGRKAKLSVKSGKLPATTKSPAEKVAALDPVIERELAARQTSKRHSQPPVDPREKLSGTDVLEEGLDSRAPRITQRAAKSDGEKPLTRPSEYQDCVNKILKIIGEVDENGGVKRKGCTARIKNECGAFLEAIEQGKIEQSVLKEMLQKLEEVKEYPDKIADIVSEYSAQWSFESYRSLNNSGSGNFKSEASAKPPVLKELEDASAVLKKYDEMPEDRIKAITADDVYNAGDNLAKALVEGKVEVEQVVDVFLNSETYHAVSELLRRIFVNEKGKTNYAVEIFGKIAEKSYEKALWIVLTYEDNVIALILNKASESYPKLNLRNRIMDDLKLMDPERHLRLLQTEWLYKNVK